MTPGLPQESNKYCDRVGRVMNYGDGLYGGMFVCGMYTAAFFESNPRQIVGQGLACIPAQSGYARVIRDVLDWSAKHPADWRATWRMIEEKWDKDDPCPDGALRPFNINARLNGAYIALGLLYGNGDFAQTLEITTRAGQDSDCNPSSSAGILGVMLGYQKIPETWKAGLPAIADTRCRTSNGMCAASAAVLNCSAIAASARLRPPDADPVTPASVVTVIASLTSGLGIADSAAWIAAKPGSAAITAPKPNSEAVFIDASRHPASAA